LPKSSRDRNGQQRKEVCGEVPDPVPNATLKKALRQLIQHEGRDVHLPTQVSSPRPLFRDEVIDLQSHYFLSLLHITQMPSPAATPSRKSCSLAEVIGHSIADFLPNGAQREAFEWFKKGALSWQLRISFCREVLSFKGRAGDVWAMYIERADPATDGVFLHDPSTMAEGFVETHFHMGSDSLLEEVADFKIVYACGRLLLEGEEEILGDDEE